MLNKLALRNAKRSMKDYIVYLITMTVITTLMFAFNSMIFSKDVMGMCRNASIMAAMLVIVTIFIVIIVAWLINYMVHFMLVRRSREFGTYLLLGMKRKEISRLYMRESLVIGAIAFLMGGMFGILFQQILMTIFYSVFGENYRVRIGCSIASVAMTFGCFFGCYLLALLRNKKMFKRMNIAELMHMENENEKIHYGREGIKQWLFFISVAYFPFFFYKLFHGPYTVMGVIIMAFLFVAAVYGIYIGLAAFISRYIEKGRKGIYRKHNLFLLRQLSSKLHTMKFTMGTLTVLLTCSLLGGTVAMMFGQYQDKVLHNTMPFDVLVYSKNPTDTFEKEIEAIEEEAGIKEKLLYHIYQNGSKEMNEYLYTHGSTINSKYKNEDGTVNTEAVKKDGYEYYDYDTYIRLSDYNALRKMLHHDTITLGENQYAIQIKKRVEKDLNEDIRKREIREGGKTLTLSSVYTDDMSQNGINGADYLIVIPDAVAECMEPYYTNLAAATKKEAPEQLQTKLEDIRHERNGIMPENEFYKLQEEGKIDEDEIWDDVTLGGYGTDQIVVVQADVLVSVPAGREMKFTLTAIVFPLVYIAFVFVCVALTILAVQQLSDSNKYRFRYDVLRKLGLSEKEIHKVILKQLLCYYMVPGVVSILLSSIIAIFVGNNFVKYTGTFGSGLYYYGIAILLFFSIYTLYFVATYVGFKKNIAQDRSMKRE